MHANTICNTPACEPLESRLLLTAAPRIAAIAGDNRAMVVLSVDRPLDPQTVNTRSIKVYRASGAASPLKATVSYNAAKRQITVRAKLGAPDQPYRIRLNSSIIRGTDGQALDGEFRSGDKSGDGVAGGDYLATLRPAATSVARFTTDLGLIDVRLFATETPLTVQNFLRYANDGEYDGTFLHRNTGATLVGGGYRVSADNRIQSIFQRAAVPNEPRPGAPGNVRGTLALEKLGSLPNSGTNQWFFNLKDNRDPLDSDKGGYTVFGQIINANGLKVLDRLAARGVVNIGSVFSSLPVKDADAVLKRGSLDPQKDLLFISRVAVLMTPGK
jgi:cyclophilin family peptidyl-prolyl cis-trans isomerase